jgi:HD-GYP domain-containing protein (c-di-GMP phosphodiesterase class II)
MVVVVCMALFSAVVVGLGWSGARDSMVETAAKSALDSGLLVTEKSRRMSEPAQATLRILATDPLSEATTQEQRLLRLRTLSDVLISNTLAESIFVGYTNGAFMLVRSLDKQATRKLLNAPPKSNFLVQSVEVKADGRKVGEYLFYTANLKLLERRSRPDYRFDPRSRPWFAASTGTDAQLLSDPYVFFTTQHVGLTMSQVSDNGKAVFGIDVVLEDLGNTLSDFRMSPNSQMALVNRHNKVLAYFDMTRVLTQEANGFGFRPIEELGVPSLLQLSTLAPPQGKVVSFEVEDKEWLGVMLPFDVWNTGDLRLLAASPSHDLLGGLQAKAENLMLLIAALTLLLIPVGWWAGGRIGDSLRKLTIHAQRMSRFDFRQTPLQPTAVMEANSLSVVLNEMGQTIQTFLEISQTMACEPQVDSMLENVLRQMVRVTRSQAGAVYLWNHETRQMQRAATLGDLLAHPQETFAYSAVAQNNSAQRALAPGIVEMQIELRGRSDRLDGLLMLQHTDDADHSDPSFTEFVYKLSGILAMSIETRRLIDAQKNLLDSVIRLMADAIDAKSPYTGGHCERVPALAGMMVDHMRAQTQGPFAEFNMTEDERYEFHLAAWLHDCGKVTSPEHIIDKATKLETIYNRIHEVRMRFEVLWRDALIDHWQAIAAGGDAKTLGDVLAVRQHTLQDNFAFVARCNVGGEFMADADIERLAAIGQIRWERNFDKRLGLSTEEARRANTSYDDALPAVERLLADRPDHVVPWGERKPAVEKGDPRNIHQFDMVLPQHAQNMGELYNLGVRRGTLTDEDRFKINDHMVQTLSMLRSLPWPEQLAKVPDIASNHHERLDGRGYPRRLPAIQLTTADRVMALADIFEALTAADRPYKAPKTLSESLKIMARMARDQHIDPELFHYFLHHKLWLVFAEEFIHPDQMDLLDIEEVDALSRSTQN